MGADIALRRRAGYIHGLRTIRRSPRVFAILQAAGWPIWPLLFASIVAVALIIERLGSRGAQSLHRASIRQATKTAGARVRYPRGVQAVMSGRAFRGVVFGLACALAFVGCLGDGGAIVTNRAAIDKRLRQLRDGGRRVREVDER